MTVKEERIGGRAPGGKAEDKDRHRKLGNQSIELLLGENLEQQREEFLILKGHLVIERALETLIGLRLTRPLKNRLSFELKLELAQNLGVLPENFVSPIKALNTIRNRIARNPEYRITVDEVRRLRLDWDSNDEAYFREHARGKRSTAFEYAVFNLFAHCLGLARRGTNMRRRVEDRAT